MRPVFICSECGQEAELCMASLVKFWHRMNLPWYVCVPCQTVYYDKREIWDVVTRLRRIDSSAKRIPFKFIYRMVKEHMDRIVQHRIKHFGARRVRFKRKA
ncbi:MAG: hypothetical protein U9Q03_06410 [Patescibacteria group bacterium]|nr:hypothetical protein [Patescibacteria group bacterium]